MNWKDAVALLPLIVLAFTSLVVMISVAVHRHHGITLGLTLAGLAAAFATLSIAAPAAPHQVTPLLIIDHYSLFYFALLIAADFPVALPDFWGLPHRRHPASSPPLLTQFKAGQCDVADANCPMTVFAPNWAAHLGRANSR